jgi:hypothetical protein
VTPAAILPSQIAAKSSKPQQSSQRTSTHGLIFVFLSDSSEDLKDADADLAAGYDGKQGARGLLALLSGPQRRSTCGESTKFIDDDSDRITVAHQLTTAQHYPRLRRHGCVEITERLCVSHQVEQF